MINIFALTAQQLHHAADLTEKIGALENKLAKLLFGSASTPAPKLKSKMSAAARAKIGAAQKARWAKVKRGTAKTSHKKVQKVKRKMSAAGRARIAAAAKARWAKVKAAGKTSL